MCFLLMCTTGQVEAGKVCQQVPFQIDANARNGVRALWLLGKSISIQPNIFSVLAMYYIVTVLHKLVSRVL